MNYLRKNREVVVAVLGGIFLISWALQRADVQVPWERIENPGAQIAPFSHPEIAKTPEFTTQEVCKDVVAAAEELPDIAFAAPDKYPNRCEALMVMEGGEFEFVFESRPNRSPIEQPCRDESGYDDRHVTWRIVDGTMTCNPDWEGYVSGEDVAGATEFVTHETTFSLVVTETSSANKNFDWVEFNDTLVSTTVESVREQDD